MRKYMPRIADKLLEKSLRTSGAVLIEGPKWCGKTSTALEMSKSHVFMQDPDQRLNNMRIADTKPSLLLRGKTPRLIDEWQLAPILWDSVRHEVDMRGSEDGTISPPTVISYLNALQRIFVTEDLEAWNPSIRSKTPLRSSPKRHFIDPSIACAALGINGKKLLSDFNTFSYLFESLCIRDLRIYADYLDGKVYHYRDKTNLECDAIIVLRDGRWGAIEVKMGAKEFDSAAKNLFELKERIYIQKMSEPSFLMILTGTDIGYTRKDGVHIVPIGCLKW